MNPETKNTPTDKTPCPVVNLSGTMDAKPYQQYKLEVRKILVRSAIFPIISIVAWPIYALIYGHAGIINFPIMHLAILLGGGFYIISKARLYAKYKIPTVYYGNNFSFSKDGYDRSSPNCNPFSSDPFRDNNPTYPGTAAWHARRMLD